MTAGKLEIPKHPSDEDAPKPWAPHLETNYPTGPVASGQPDSQTPFPYVHPDLDLGYGKLPDGDPQPQPMLQPVPGEGPQPGDLPSTDNNADGYYNFNYDVTPQLQMGVLIPQASDGPDSPTSPDITKPEDMTPYQGTKPPDWWNQAF
jgi:hypothetical protein